MAKRDRLLEIEKERGEPLRTLIPRLLNKYGKPADVAGELKCHPNTIRRWMKQEGVRRVKTVRFVLPEAEHAAG